MRTLNAFVAHSFAPEDQIKIRPILSQLEAFHELGFTWKSGEPAEADRVSDKIRRRISDAQIFIGILTHKHPVFDFKNVYRSAWQLVRKKKLQPMLWSPPAWIIQESGFALALERKVILFLEPNLDFPALQGDLEYIPYDYQDPSDAIRRVSQMVSKLLAEQAGIAVETVLRDQSEEQPKEKLSPVDEVKEEVTESQTPKPGLDPIFREFFEAIGKKDLALARKQLNAGVKLIRAGGSTTPELRWRCFCLSELYGAEDVAALHELKQLHTENPEDPAPPSFIAHAFSSFNQHADAATYYLQAANLSKDEDEKATRLLSYANALISAKQSVQAEPVLIRLMQGPESETRTQAVQKLYEILKSSGRHFEAFGVAEALLRENPVLTGFRFTLGLDYNRQDQRELFLYHFHLLKEHDPSRSDIMHNTALALGECNLPISSVHHYKHAIELGGTLAASNLGYKYIDAGIVDEATAMLKEVMKKEDVEPDVGRCLAAIAEREEKEANLFEKSIENAERQRAFLVALGKGLHQNELPALDGFWEMPFGRIQLRVREGALDGSAEITHDLSRYGSLYGLLSGIGTTGPPSRDIKQVRIHSITGPVIGSTSRFTITARPKEGSSPLGYISGPEDSTQGYLIFRPDGQSALYAELKEGKLSHFQTINRVGSP